MSEERVLADARSHVRTAQYDWAMHGLRACEDWPSPLAEQGLLVRAEVLTRRDPVRALEFLARISDLCMADDALAFGYFIAAGKAHGNSRNFDSAREMFNAAEPYVAGDPATRAPRLAYHRARLAWLTDEFDPESADMVAALADPDPGLRQEAYLVRAWMHAGLQNYEAQVEDLISAVRLAETDLDKCDYFIVGRVLHSLFRIAFELGDFDAVAAGERVYNAMEWTDDIRDAQYLALRALAWDAFLRGESAKAQWLFRDSKGIAPTPAWKVMAHVDRAYVARINRNEMWAVDELHQAHEIARDVVWASTTGEERQALVTLAVLFAPVDMAHAQHYVSTYIRLGGHNLDPTLAIAHDRRAVGFERYASGRVSQVMGHTAAAVKAFEASYAVFNEAGHHFRAALAAQGLAEATKSETWREVARMHAAKFPDSALFARLTEKIATPMPLLNELTPMQRQLAVGLRDGLNVGELSQRFSRSEFTLKREIAAVLDAFGVSDRNGLREALAERGLG